MFEGVHAELDRLKADPLDVPSCLGDEIIELNRIEAEVAAQKLRRLVAYDRSGGWAEQGHLSTGAWLAHKANMTRSAAGGQVSTARTLHDQMPDTAEVFANGEVSYSHVRVAAAVVADLPREVRGKADEQLAVHAVDLDPARLRIVGEHLKEIFAPERRRKDDEARQAGRRLSAGVGFDGMVNVHGRLEPAVGAKLMAGLSAASRPDGEGEVRTAGQRKADAFNVLLDHALDAGRLPEQGGERPHLVVTVDLDKLRTTTTAGADGVRDHQIDPAGLPIVEWAGPITAETARRIACDAGVTRVLMRGPSEVLDVGRKTRVIPTALRLLIKLRDQTCRWSGCDLPAQWCEVHHVRPWTDGGATDSHNCLLLCPRHHTAAHSGQWIVTLQAPGKITVRSRRSSTEPLYEIRPRGPDLSGSG